jgi:hypothetical protein
MIIVFTMSTDQEHVDVTTEPEAPPTYAGDRDGLRQASADLQADRDERAADTARRAVTPEQRERAKRELRKRVAEHAGIREEDIDLDHPTWQGAEPPTLRTAAKAIVDYRKTVDAAEADVITQQGQEDALAEVERVVAANEAEDRAQAEQQQRQADEQRQRAVAEQSQQRLTAREQEIAVGLRQLDQAVAQRFPELPQLIEFARQNPAAAPQLFAAWEQQNPQRAAELARAHAHYLQGQQEAARIAQSRQGAEEFEFNTAYRRAGEELVQAHPELRDAKHFARMQAATIEMLKADYGITTDEELAQLVRTDPVLRGALRTPKGQKALYRMAKQYVSEQYMKDINKQRVPPYVPPVQRPGTRTGPLNGRSNDSAVEAAEQRFRAASGTRAQIRAAADKIKAQRAARR